MEFYNFHIKHKLIKQRESTKHTYTQTAKSRRQRGRLISLGYELGDGGEA